MLVPKLRFKREDGTDFPEWEEKRIGEILTLCHGKDYKHLKKGDIPVMGTGGVITYVNEALCDWQCVCIGRKGTIDRPYFMDKPFWSVDTLFYSKPLGDNMPKFQYYLFQNINWLFYNEASGVPSLSASTIENIIVKVPTVEEQQKIADFLSTVDEVIAQSEAEVANLQQQKKAAMQKIFSQEVRFKREDGTSYPEWEELPLGQIVEQNNIPVENPGSNYVKLAIRSHCKGTFHKPINSKEDGLDVDKMYLVEANNLIVNITFAWEHAIAITKPEDAGTYVSHRFPQYKFVNGNIPAFYAYVIKNPRMKYEMGLCSPGGAGRNRVLKQNDFLLIPMARPCIEEQQKIADFLATYDEAISCAKQELDKWKELKKGLLQQMFA